jgi:hypothetical protein
MMETTLALKALGFLGTVWQSLRRVRVQAHRGVLLVADDPCLFVNVTNLSSKRDVEVTHVWLETHPALVVLNHDRPLPKRLKPDESWETWFPLDLIPASELPFAEYAGRVQLSNGSVFRSVLRRKIPAAGFIPGG